MLLYTVQCTLWTYRTLYAVTLPLLQKKKNLEYYELIERKYKNYKINIKEIKGDPGEVAGDNAGGPIQEWRSSKAKELSLPPPQGDVVAICGTSGSNAFFDKQIKKGGKGCMCIICFCEVTKCFNC